MDKNSVKALKAAWQKYYQNPTDKNRDDFMRQMELHHFSVFSCLELYSR
jgi:hypothetical protein